MSEYPLLAAMRRQAVQRERATVEPYVRDAAYWQGRAAGAEESIHVLERKLAGEMGKHFFERLGETIVYEAHKVIMKAIFASEPDSNDIMNIRIPKETLLVADQKTVEHMVIQRARHMMADNLSVHLSVDDGVVAVDTIIRELRLADLRLRSRI